MGQLSATHQNLRAHKVMKVIKQTDKKSKKLNKAWLNDHLNDPYVKLAKREGYRARAAYKLKQIDELTSLIHAGMTVVDLGASPGAWSQYLAKKNCALVVALDILQMEPIKGVQFIQGDIREQLVLDSLEQALGGQAVDVVLSDMAPNLSGVAAADAARMTHLVEIALEFALNHLTPTGALVVKVFHGSGYSQIVKLFKESFEVVKPLKPQASRDKSAENFLLGIRPKRLIKVHD